MTPLLITPSLMRYAWGDPAFIPRLMGSTPSGEPIAEAWFGAHPVAPASVTIDGEDRPLDRVIAERPAILGPAVSARFGGLPYLLKILAAAKPLSIQVHPDAEQAAVGFAREERAGVPRDAPERCYRDPHHKPEVIVALTGFDALAGFRPPSEIAAALDALPELRALLPRYEPTTEGLRALLEAYFAIPDETLRPALDRMLARLATEERDPHAEWALRAHQGLSGPPDRGLFFVFLLGLIHLEPGEGIFLSAGVPHAYLRGAGVELMASSDNVLRAGLTPKHVDAAELMRVVRFDAGPPPVLRPVDGEYPIPAPELALSRLAVDPGAPITRVASGPETLLALPDDASTIVEVGELALRRGQACLVPDGERVAITASAPAVVFRVGVP